MILVPQIYLKNGKAVLLDGTTSPLFNEDPISTARALKDVGVEAIYFVDLSIPPVGTSPNLPIIKQIHDEAGVAVYVGGGFKTSHCIEGFVNAGVELIGIGTFAYQQPAFLDEVCKRFPGKIAVHIDVKGGHVTIPGYTVVANKTAFDYAEQFLRSGVRYIFYSDIGTNGTIATENLASILAFCKKATGRIICTSEISGLSDIEKIAKLGALRLDGIVVAKPIYDGRIDLRSAITMVNDLTLARGEESTLTEM